MKEIIFDVLKMTNFRKHEYMDFRFTPNRFVTIVGENGAGKSTIIDALCWALYDKTTKGRTGDAVLRKRHPKDCSVFLSFTIDGVAFTIEAYRKHKKFGDKKILTIGGEDKTLATRPLTNKYIEDIIMPYDIFVNCLIFSQYVEKSFTEMSDGGQKNILDKMLGLTHYDKYQDKFKDGEKEINEIIEKKQTSFDALIKEIDTYNALMEKERKYLDDILPVKQKEIEDLKDDLVNLQNDIDIHKQMLVNIGPLKKQQTDCIEELAKLNASYNIIKNEVEAKLKELEARYTAILDSSKKDISLKYQENINTLKNQISEIDQIDMKNISDFELERSVVENEYKTLCSQSSEVLKHIVADISPQLSKATEDERSIREFIISSNNTMDEYSIEVDRYNEYLKKDKPECPVCEQELADANLKKVQDKLQNINNLWKILEDKVHIEQPKLEPLRIAISGMEEALQNAEEDHNRKISSYNDTKTMNMLSINDRHDSCIKTNAKTKNALSIQLNEINNKEQEELRTVISNLQKQAGEEANTIKNNNKTQETDVADKIYSIRKSLEKIEEQLAECDHTQITINTILSNMERKREAINNFTVAIEEQKERTESTINGYQTHINSKNETIGKLQKEVDNAFKVADIIKFWKKGFSDTGIKALILDESIPILNKKAIELSRMTENIRVSFDSQKQIGSGEMRNKFSTNVINTKELSDNRDDMSGGEGRQIDIITLLCLRNLLEIMVGARFNILLLDEILDSLSPNNVEIILNMLRQLALDHCVVLISHTLRDQEPGDEILTM